MSKPKEKTLDVTKDGKTHINIYSSGRTVLGRALSNFSYYRFTHDELGTFSGMEGLYYYISTGMKHDAFRRLAGFSAKKLGKQLPRIEMKKEEFERLLRLGCRAVYRDNPKIHDLILDQVIENKGELVPFVHYYLNGLTASVPVGNEWLVEEWEAIRKDALEQAGGTIYEVDDRLFVKGIETEE